MNPPRPPLTTAELNEARRGIPAFGRPAQETKYPTITRNGTVLPVPFRMEHVTYGGLRAVRHRCEWPVGGRTMVTVPLTMNTSQPQALVATCDLASGDLVVTAESTGQQLAGAEWNGQSFVGVWGALADPTAWTAIVTALMLYPELQ